MKETTRNLKKRAISFILAATMLLSMSMSAMASGATVTYKFTKSGTTYTASTTSTGFSGYVTSWAKVKNTNTGTYKYSEVKAYKSSSASATKTISYCKGKHGLRHPTSYNEGGRQ